jgi:hypothetical protein
MGNQPSRGGGTRRPSYDRHASSLTVGAYDNRDRRKRRSPSRHTEDDDDDDAGSGSAIRSFLSIRQKGSHSNLRKASSKRPVSPKKLQVSNPTRVEHGIHVEFDKETGDFVVHWCEMDNSG